MVGKSSPETMDTSFLRKLRKPMIEKKRRDRINVSIDHMKAILAKSSKNAGSVAKMDKAEILELAVVHLTQMQQRSKHSSSNNVTSYRAGFRECMKETHRYLSSAALMPQPLLQDLDNHLRDACFSSRQNETNMSPAARRHDLLPEPLCTSSPTLALPPAPAFSPFCSDSLFSPISSADIRGHRVGSPVDILYADSLNRSISPFGTQLPVSSSCSPVTCDSSTSGMSFDSSSDLDRGSSKPDIFMGHVIRQEAPWRPW